MPAAATPQSAATRPRGNFEIAPEFNEAPHESDVVYECFHGHYLTNFESFTSLRSHVLRGITRHEGYVNVSVVAGEAVICLDYTAEQTRTLAAMLLLAADDLDAAVAQLVAEKKGGAA